MPRQLSCTAFHTPLHVHPHIQFVEKLALAKPLGAYMAAVYEGRSAVVRICSPFERLIYRLCGVSESKEMGWVEYTVALLVFNLLGALAVYGLQRLQASLPFNPAAMGAV